MHSGGSRERYFSLPFAVSRMPTFLDSWPYITLPFVSIVIAPSLRTSLLPPSDNDPCDYIGSLDNPGKYPYPKHHKLITSENPLLPCKVTYPQVWVELSKVHCYIPGLPNQFLLYLSIFHSSHLVFFALFLGFIVLLSRKEHEKMRLFYFVPIKKIHTHRKKKTTTTIILSFLPVP